MEKEETGQTSSVSFTEVKEEKTETKQRGKDNFILPVVVFFFYPFHSGDIVKGEFLIYCVRALLYYYQCCVCGSGPIAEGLWGTAHLTGTGVSLFSVSSQSTIFNSAASCIWGFLAIVAGFFPTWIIQGITEQCWPILLTPLSALTTI